MSKYPQGNPPLRRKEISPVDTNWLIEGVHGAVCTRSHVLNFLQEKEGRGVTSLPAERPVRRGGASQRRAVRGPTLPLPQSRAARARNQPGDRGDFPRRQPDTAHGHNAAAPAEPGADVTAHKPEEAEPPCPPVASGSAAARSVSLEEAADMSSLTVEEEEQTWVPTHVQVTVLRGRGLRGKGKHGTSDVYAIIQLGKEKYSTGVAEKTTEPEWREECSFELQPGVLQGGGRSGYPAGGSELVLTVMHRALMGLDVFLGQAVVQLDEVFNQSRWVKNQWYRLNSKTGKKEKERGDIQVSVQFTRNNLTASMYDLVMKDKGTSTFNKLKERMRGKRRSSEEDSSSAVVPGGNGSGSRVRTRLPSDGGGEEDYEDDEGGEARRSKMRTFFLRGKLRKSSDTRSSTSLGSESSESSRGGSLSPTAGISVVVSDLSNSPSNSSNLTADYSPEHTENTSPKSSSLRCDSGDEAGEITIAVPQLTVNGSHAYKVQPLDPGSGKPVDSLGLGLLQKSLPVSVSLQNLSPRASADPHKAPGGDGRRWSFDKPGEEEKAAIAAALEQSGPMQGEEEEEERLGRAALSESQGKKQRGKGSKDGAGGGPRGHPGETQGLVRIQGLTLQTQPGGVT
ncbi:unnamed protein product [Pleuronectes platessa]|uniref:C2 domain-containing protein n=1 Tax=Pleuronectes platessa TaxID=8262 RepID=A0A9N7VQX2_PLEPL|nr:unnamed protein product [Pleuronectes platessa]